MKGKNLFRNSIAILIVVIAVIVGATGCGSDTSSKTTSDTKVIRIGTTGQDAESSLLDNAQYSYKLGYLQDELKKEGYTVELKGFAQAGPAVNEAFAANEIDVAVYAEFPLITAVSNGVDLKGFALSTSQLNFGILARKGSGIKSISDLEGKNVVVALGTISQKYFLEVTKKNNVDVSKINQLNSISDAQTLLASGDADAVVSTVSSLAVFENAGLGKVIIDSSNDSSLSSGFLFAGRNQWLKENPKAAIAISKALIRSQEEAEKNPTDVYKKLATKDSPESIFKEVYSYDETFSFFKPDITDDYINRAKSIEKFMEDNKLIKSSVDVFKILDNQYVEKARESLNK